MNIDSKINKAKIPPKKYSRRDEFAALMMY